MRKKKEAKKTERGKKTKKTKPSKKTKKEAKKKVTKITKKVRKVKKIAKKVKKKVTKPPTLPSPRPQKRVYTPEEMVEEAKYFEPVEVPYPPKEELPSGYGENRIVIMARDPNWSFAYWEITPETLEEVKARAGQEANLTLRVYDVTGIDFDGKNALSSFDIGIYERIGSWYIELGRPDRSFCVDLGLLTPEGSFVTIARSNIIKTPRDRVSEITDERFMIMEEEFQKVFTISGGSGVGLSSPQLQEIIKRRFFEEISSPKK